MRQRQSLTHYEAAFVAAEFATHAHLCESRARRVMLCDPTGRTVIDYWDLPMRNAEGIAINNQHDPPLMFISTDSASGSRKYAGLFFKFAKPVAGTGNMGQCNVFKPESCDGCDEVCTELQSRGHHCQFFEDWSVHVFDPDYAKHHRKPESPTPAWVWAVVAVGSIGAIVVVLAAVAGIVYAVVRRKRATPAARKKRGKVVVDDTELETFDAGSTE